MIKSSALQKWRISWNMDIKKFKIMVNHVIIITLICTSGSFYKSAMNILPGRCNIVISATLAKFTFFCKYEIAGYSARFHEKFILRKLIIFVKFMIQNVICAHEFSWITKKDLHTINDILGILAVISGAIFVENNFF